MNLYDEIEHLRKEIIEKCVNKEKYNKAYNEVEKDLKERNKLFNKPTNSNVIIKIMEEAYNTLLDYKKTNLATNIKTVELKMECYNQIRGKARRANINKEGIKGGVIGGIVGSIFGLGGAIVGALAGGLVNNNSNDKDRFEATLKDCLNYYLDCIYDTNKKYEGVFNYDEKNHNDTYDYNEFYDEYMSNKTEDE